MNERVRLLHSIYDTDTGTGNRVLVAREGQTAVLERSCFDHAGQSVDELLRWKDDVRIRVDGSEEWISVNCWNVEPVG